MRELRPHNCYLASGGGLLKLHALEGGLPGKGASFYGVPLASALKAGACGAHAGHPKPLNGGSFDRGTAACDTDLRWVVLTNVS